MCELPQGSDNRGIFLVVDGVLEVVSLDDLGFSVPVVGFVGC